MTRSIASHVAIMSVCWLLSVADVPQCVIAADKYPTFDQLPANDELPDPFQFFVRDRRVETIEDWERRQAEMVEMLQHYIYGPAFPQVNEYKVESRTEEPVAGGEVIKYTANLKLGPDLKPDPIDQRMVGRAIMNRCDSYMPALVEWSIAMFTAKTSMGRTCVTQLGLPKNLYQSL